MSPRAWLLFATTSLVWGVPYLFIKVAVDADVPPAFVAWSRIALAAALLLPLAAGRGVLGGVRAHWRAIAAYAFCEIAAPFTLISIGETRVSSSLTAILIASMPLQTALLAIRFAPHERVTGMRLAGLGVGLVGVVALLGLDVAGSPGELLGAGLILLATLCYSCSALIVQRWLSALDPVAPVSVGLGLATVALLPAALLAPPDGLPPARALASIAVLGIVCTALGLLVFFQLIAEAGPSRASVITYVNPLVAVVLGVLLLDERLGAASLTGLVLILLGSWLSTRRRRERAPARPLPAQGPQRELQP